MACELQFTKPRERQANLNQGTVYEKKLPGLFKNVNFVKYQEGLRSCSRLKDPKEIQWLGVTHDLATGSFRARGSSRPGVGGCPGHHPCPLGLDFSGLSRRLLEGENLRFRDWMRGPGMGVGGTRNPPASSSPSHTTASFATSPLSPGKRRRGGRYTGCAPLRSVPSAARVTLE